MSRSNVNIEAAYFYCLKKKKKKKKTVKFDRRNNINKFSPFSQLSSVPNC